MKKNIFRAMALVLSILMVLVLFAGCKDKEPSKSSSDASSKPQGEQDDQKPQGPEELVLPIVKEPLTLTYFTDLGFKAVTVMKSYNEMRLFQELEKKTGIHIEFVHPAVGQETEQFNLMIASQQLTDMIQWGWRSIPGGPSKALDDKSIIELNQWIDKYAPNFKKIMDEHPEWRKQAVTDDGKFYMFPFIRGAELNLIISGF